jgi:hypothetical protein
MLPWCIGVRKFIELLYGGSRFFIWIELWVNGVLVRRVVRNVRFIILALLIIFFDVIWRVIRYSLSISLCLIFINHRRHRSILFLTSLWLGFELLLFLMVFRLWLIIIEIIIHRWMERPHMRWFPSIRILPCFKLRVEIVHIAILLTYLIESLVIPFVSHFRMTIKQCN